jgi:hypothetical protein
MVIFHHMVPTSPLGMYPLKPRAMRMVPVLSDSQ